MNDDPPSSARTLVGLLDEQAERRPDADALTDGTDRLTWRQYRDAAAGLAGALAEHGVVAGDRVGVHLTKSVRSFVTVHAILRGGAIMVPLDCFAPTAHARDLLGDAGATALVTDASGPRLEALLDTGAVVVHPDERRQGPGAPAVAPDDPAYIIYTSGSTGRPKGILHTHASALAYASRAAAAYALTADDRLANFAPLHFDQSTFELYAGPLAGSAVLVIPDAVLRFPASLGELVARERCTVWYSVPFAITQLTERGGLDGRDMSSVRWVLFGGESYPPSDLAAAMRALPGARFSNVYGPAEVNQCTFHHVQGHDAEAGPIPIGRPWDGAAIRLVDGEGRVVADGEQGELLVSTDTMMHGYWNRPDLTAAAIETDRSGDVLQRWYRTGDLAVRRPDGALVFLGRRDHQVKVRGHRVELEAIELEATASDPEIEACAVLVDGDRLVALVSPAIDDGARRILLRHLRDRLPRASVPDEIVGVAGLPRTGTGKIDRRAAASLLPPR